jgi:hypothetical protein
MAETTKQPNGDNNPHGGSHESNPQVAFERRDVNVFQITSFGIGLLIAVMVAVFAMWALFAFLAKREDARNVPIPRQMENERQTIPPEPRLSGVRVEDGKIVSPVYPRIELRELKDDENAILNNYAWVDPNAGIVRIPIDQAIDIVSQNGKLPQKPSPGGMENDGYRTIPSVASGGRMLEKISQ